VISRIPAALATLGRIGRATRRRRQRLRTGRRIPIDPWKTPRLPISRSISDAREVGTLDLPLDELMEIRRAFGTTFNDVFLGIVTGGLRSWLGPDCPDGPVVALVPVSVRDGSAVSTNLLSGYFAGLPVHLADVEERVRDVAAEMEAVKERHDDLGRAGLDGLLDVIPWRLVGHRFGRYCEGGRADSGRLVANLLATSLRGPGTTFALGGARVVAIDPFAPIFDGITVNVTGLSFAGRFRIGITGAPGVGSGLAALVVALTEAHAELLAVARRLPPPGPAPVPGPA